MVWVRIDDQFPQHPKVAKVGPLGMALQVAGLCYCNRYLTDGFIPTGIARTLLDFTGLGMKMWSNELFGAGEDASAKLVIEALVEAEIWEEVDGGYMIHDYKDYQPSRAMVESERHAKVAAGQAGGLASAMARAKAGGQAKSKPVPVPVPVPVPSSQPLTLSESAADAATLSRNGVEPLKKVSQKKPLAVTDAFKERMVQKYGASLGETGVREAIADALAHKAADRWKDTERYVGNWIKREVERHGTQGVASPAGKAGKAEWYPGVQVLGDEPEPDA